MRVFGHDLASLELMAGWSFPHARFVRRAGASLVLALTLALATTSHGADWKWSPPPGGIVRDKSAAISIARIVWFSTNPALPKPSDETWQKRMVAIRSGNIWKVYEKSIPTGSLGGGLEIDIDARDARVTKIILTQ